MSQYPPQQGQYPPQQQQGYPPGAAAGAAPQRWQPGMGGPPQEWQNAAEPPMIDNPNAAPGAVPQMANLPTFQGYGNITENFGPAPPPPPPTGPTGQPPLMEFDKVADLSQEQCREAMIEYAASNCCYGSKPAKEHEIKKITASTALHYTLESYCEARETGYKNEPYRGQPIDGPEFGMPPPPWAIPCEPDCLFKNHSKLMPVPHTGSIQPCHHCHAMGYTRCYRCHGRGQVRCNRCGGDGRVRVTDHEGHSRQERCSSCGGDGRRRCYTCGGDGRITCSTCDGYCRLHVFVQLKVTFIDHVEDFIREETDMPDELVRKVSGTKAFEQTLPQVWPIQHYPITEVAQASLRMVDSHRKRWPNERMLHQRQTLEAIPVTEVDAQWDDWKSRYWVYGRERQVYCSDYPQTCCWGCEIL